MTEISTLDLAPAVRAIMAEAGELLIGIFHAFDETTHLLEGGQEAVTTGDVEAEKLLSTRLMQLLPGSIAIGEEDLAMRHKLMLDPPRFGAENSVWFIDPIDGTRSFRHKQDDWAVMVGLQRHGELVGGWIYFPRQNIWLEGIAGHGATVNDKPVTLQSAVEQTDSVALIDPYHFPAGQYAPGLRRNDLQEEQDAVLAEVGEQVTVQLDEVYSCKEILALLTGAAQLLCHANGYAWDNAAGVAIWRAAGGVVRFLDGTRYEIAGTADIQMRRRGLLYAPDIEAFEAAAEAFAPLRAHLSRQGFL